MMRSAAIQELIEAIEATHGPISTYGMDPSVEHGAYFDIEGVPALFSVHTREGTLPFGVYDVQIEGIPPGDYIFTSVVPLDELLQLIARFQGPVDGWPSMNEETG